MDRPGIRPIPGTYRFDRACVQLVAEGWRLVLGAGAGADPTDQQSAISNQQSAICDLQALTIPSRSGAAGNRDVCVPLQCIWPHLQRRFDRDSEYVAVQPALENHGAGLVAAGAALLVDVTDRGE